LVYLIDASVYVFRAWHSMPPDINDADGNPTHALYGFARFLNDLIERRRPERVGVAFDESLSSSFRQKIYPPYKANREPAPVELKRQFALCREYCRHLGVAEYASPEFEADDLIGTLAARARSEGFKVTVVSRDKDLSQLIEPGDVFWDYSDGAEYRYEHIAARFGVAPERMADYLALAGDAVDNIPGVPGIGRKTAAALMNVFESLEALYDNLSAVADMPLRGASGLRLRLQTHREAAFTAQRLTRIHCAAPLEGGGERLQRRNPDLDSLGRFCSAQGFGMLLPRQAERLTLRSA
jgi:5'-3' exonuclease